MTVLVIPIEVGALVKVLKLLEKELVELEIRGQIETLQTSLLLRLARILRILETWGDLIYF